MCRLHHIEIGRDAGRAESVAADLDAHAELGGAAAALPGARRDVPHFAEPLARVARWPTQLASPFHKSC
jgi:hypothetical protein